MIATRIRGTKKKTWGCVPTNNTVYISVTTVTSIVSCDKMTTVHIYPRLMTRTFILQIDAVCVISQERETRCSFVEWSGGN